MNKKLLFAILLTFLLSFALASADYTTAAWGFTCDNADFSGIHPIDESGNGVLATNNGVATGATGLINEACDFEKDDLDDSFDITNYTLAASTDKTLSVWLKPETVSTGANIFDTASGRLIAALTDGAGANDYVAYFDGSWKHDGSTQASTGVWQHFVWVFKSSTNRAFIYIDGNLIYNGTYTDKAIGGATRIGKHNTNSGSGTYDGLLDEIYFYAEALSLSDITSLYNGGLGCNPYDGCSGGFTVEIDNYYLSPNSSVYTDESDLRGYVERNETGSFYINYTYKVNGADITSGQYTGSPSGDLYTLPVFSNSNFVQGDNITFTALLVNQTDGSALSNSITSDALEISNRAPTATLSWSSLFPLNNSNFTANVLPADSDADELNITYTIFKNGAFYAGGSSSEQTSPYTTVVVYTVDEANTNVGDNWTFFANVTDARETYESTVSDTATVTESNNFTITVTDEWTGGTINYVTATIETNITFNSVTSGGSNTSFSIDIPTHYFTNASVFYNNTEYAVNGNCIQDYYPESIRFIWFNSTKELLCSDFTTSVDGVTYPVINGFTDENINLTVYGDVEKTFNGSTITDIDSNQTANITLQAIDYFGKNFTEWPLNQSLAATLYQSVITFSSYELITGNPVSNVVYSVSGTNETQFNLSAGEHTVEANASGYYSLSQNFNVSALDIKTVNVTGLYDQIINVTVVAEPANTTVSTFNITITYDTYSESYTTTSGYIEVPTIKNLEYNITVDGLGTYASASETVNSSSAVYDLEFGVWPFNSVRITIYNGTTSNLLAQNVLISVLGNVTSWTESTSNGSITLALLQPQEYELRFNSSGFNTVSIFALVNNDSTQEIEVYMTLSNGTSVQRIRVVDGTNTIVEGAIVRVQKEVIGGSENFYTIQEAKTNAEGIVFVNIIKDPSIYYRFSVIYEDITRELIPSGSIVTTKTSFLSTIDEVLQLAVDLTTLDGDEVEVINGLSGEITRVNDTFTFVYSDAGNVISNAYLLIQAKYLNETDKSIITVATNSSTSATGTLTYTVPNISNTIWYAKGYVTLTSGDILLDEKVHVKTGDETPFEPSNGAFYAAILFTFVAVLTLASGVVVSSIVSFGIVLALSLLNILILPAGIITGFLAICLIAFIRPRKNGEGEL